MAVCPYQTQTFSLETSKNIIVLIWTRDHPTNNLRRNLVGLSCVKIRIDKQYVNSVEDSFMNQLLDEWINEANPGRGSHLDQLTDLHPPGGKPLPHSVSACVLQPHCATTPWPLYGSAWRCCLPRSPARPSSSAGNGKATLYHTTRCCCVWNTFFTLLMSFSVFHVACDENQRNAFRRSCPDVLFFFYLKYCLLGKIKTCQSFFCFSKQILEFACNELLQFQSSSLFERQQQGGGPALRNVPVSECNS